MPERRALRYAVIEVTNRCNLRCPHCPSTSGAPRSHELSLEEIQALLQDIHALGGEGITLLGGEVLLREDWVEIGRAVRDLGMRLVFISNGLLFRTDEDVARLASLTPHLVGISLDGASPETYRRQRGADGFDHALGLLHRLVAEGFPHVNAITTFSRDNLHEFDDFAVLLADTGITWQVQIANKGGDRFDDGLFFTLDDYRWLVGKMRDIWVSHRDRVHLQWMDDLGYFPLDPKLRFLHQTWRGCIAGLELIGVRSSGDVLGCLFLSDDAFVEGNIRQQPLAELWQSDAAFQRYRRKEELLTGACARCAFAERCRAGCSAMAWSITGDLGCDPYCIRSIETAELLAAVDDRPPSAS